MAESFNKLWKLLIDRKMKKKDLQQLAGVSASLITKLDRDESVTTDALAKICNALKCNIGDIMDIIPVVHIVQAESICEKGNKVTILSNQDEPATITNQDNSEKALYTEIDNKTVKQVA